MKSRPGEKAGKLVRLPLLSLENVGMSPTMV